MKTILLTGFEPFGGSHINPSIEACRPYYGKTINGVKVKVVEIPLRYDEVKPVLIKAIRETSPATVICTGQTGTSAIRLERVAINIVDARIPYNCGTQPKDRTIEQDGPVAYFSKLPLRNLMHYVSEENLDIPAGFIHVPSLPEQVIGTNKPSMSLSLIIEALGIVLDNVSSDI